MKVKNLKSLIMLALVLLVASACGKKSNSEEVSDQNFVPVNSVPSSSSSSIPAPTPVATATPTPTATATPSPAGACGSTYAARGTYQYMLTGGPTDSRSTTAADIVADQFLRVSIEPLPGGQIKGTGAMTAYTLMGETVELIDQYGSVIASAYLPAASIDADGFKRGLPVSKKSDPATADFSYALKSKGKYSIRVSNILTDLKCNNNCNPIDNGCGFAPSYCMYAAYSYGAAFQWVKDPRNGGQYWCCSNNMLQSCLKLQCGVSSMSGITGATWNLKVHVETDNTTCITP